MYECVTISDVMAKSIDFVSDCTVLMPLEIFFLFCCLVSFVTALVSLGALYPQTLKWGYGHSCLFLIYHLFIN